mmetsp:Transcript_28704/g.66609  ORF Transcript_28704/g.66609 Transcript_28704/m.66609 type:complete len:401 (-) Transcript_28704:480-1682(-)
MAPMSHFCIHGNWHRWNLIVVVGAVLGVGVVILSWRLGSHIRRRWCTAPQVRQPLLAEKLVAFEVALRWCQLQRWCCILIHRRPGRLVRYAVLADAPAHEAAGPVQSVDAALGCLTLRCCQSEQLRALLRVLLAQRAEKLHVLEHDSIQLLAIHLRRIHERADVIEPLHRIRRTLVQRPRSICSCQHGWSLLQHLRSLLLLLGAFIRLLLKLLLVDELLPLHLSHMPPVFLCGVQLECGLGAGGRLVEHLLRGMSLELRQRRLPRPKLLLVLLRFFARHCPFLRLWRRRSARSSLTHLLLRQQLLRVLSLQRRGCGLLVRWRLLSMRRFWLGSRSVGRLLLLSRSHIMGCAGVHILWLSSFRAGGVAPQVWMVCVGLRILVLTATLSIVSGPGRPIAFPS